MDVDVDAAARERLVWALRRASQHVESEKAERLRPHGLHAAHYSLLINVADTPGITGAELARRLGVTAQNVATLVTRLEERGLLERRVHPLHRNVLELHLTGLGDSVVTAADHAVATLEHDLAAVLGPTDSAHLRRILERLTRELPSSTPSPP